MSKFAHPEILVELLKMRQLPEDQAKTAANLFRELANDPNWAGWMPKGEAAPPPLPGSAPEPVPPVLAGAESEESLNDFIRELLERMLLLPVQMLLDRLPEEQRERLRKKIVL